MKTPWDTPAGRTSFPDIAAAEAAIIAAGYVRDTNRHVWANGNRTAKVMRDDAKKDLKFYVQWA